MREIDGTPGVRIDCNDGRNGPFWGSFSRLHTHRCLGMPRPAAILQPGPQGKDRIVAVAGWGRRFDFEVRAGGLLLAEVAAGFRAEGFSSGIAWFSDLSLGPFGYVMPALAPSPRHAAYYSAPHRPTGVTRTHAGALTFGTRDGIGYFHAHGLWREADGRESGGHILPEETVLASHGRLQAIGLSGAGFLAREDSEINFKVFGPVPAPRRAAAADQRVLAVRLRPNQDFAGALESLCQKRGIRRATVVGGVGSTIGAGFVDGREVVPFATEIFLTCGRISPDADGLPRAELDIGLVDLSGQTLRGRLTRGDNPVLMTVELVLIIDEPA